MAYMEALYLNAPGHGNQCVADPNSCRWCGVPRGNHGRRWIDGVGMHAWEIPTPSLRLARMRERRSLTLQRIGSRLR